MHMWYSANNAGSTTVPCTLGRMPMVGTTDARTYRSPNTSESLLPNGWSNYHTSQSFCIYHDNQRGAPHGGLYPGVLIEPGTFG